MFEIKKVPYMCPDIPARCLFVFRRLLPATLVRTLQENFVLMFLQYIPRRRVLKWTRRFGLLLFECSLNS